MTSSGTIIVTPSPVTVRVRCKVCGEWFSAERQSRRFCSDACRMKAYRKRRRTRRAKVTRNNGNQEWYTPSEYIEAAREVLGEIDLDPASCDVAQQTVTARVYYTREQDELAKDWRGRVWMNPPYSTGLVERFMDKLIRGYSLGDVPEAITLTNNSTETRWFQRAIGESSGMCLPSSRVRFLNEAGEPIASPLQGQALLYFGDDAERFAGTFRKFGVCR